MSWNADTIVKKSTPPLTEGMVRKGGRNQGSSQVKERPAAPGKTKAMSDDNIDTSSWETVGRNLRFATIDGTLFIAVPIDEKSIKGAPVSASGKSKVIGSTLGNVGVTGSEIKFGVNVYTKV